MHDLNALQLQIKNKLAKSDEQRQAMQAGLQQTMEDMERRSRRFVEIATPLFESVIRPRVEMLASFFGNAHIQKDTPHHPLHCVCCFDHNEAYPATTKLTFGIDPEDKMGHLIVSYSLEILPVFFHFDGHDQEVINVDQARSDSVARWVDRKILDFLDTYMHLQHVDQYQRDNVVVDPVCGMRFNKMIAPFRTEHAGRSYFFCTEECLRQFMNNPPGVVPGAHVQTVQ